MSRRIFNLKIILILLVVGLFYLINASTSFAIAPGDSCDPTVPTQSQCDNDQYGFSYSCLPAKAPPPAFLCQRDVFGKIQPPPAIKSFLGQDVTGAAGISKFLSNFIVLIYTVAAIVLIFMLLWGAFDWMTSEGNKEKLQAAQSKIIAAVVGLMLFAVAFAVIAVLGQFTGFTFFSGQ